MDWFRKFMQNRYGSDQLTWFFLTLFWLFSLIGLFTSLRIIQYLAFVSLFTAAFRFLSKSKARRRWENQKFLEMARPVTEWFSLTRRRIRERKTHRFYKCPGCGRILRVPAGKGKITIHCSKCGAALEKKT